MDQVAQIREKIDIVSFISEFIPLKKAGRNFKANCPFHNENTPSFVVSAERQIWHCFGCSKGGDCFSFLMEYDHLEFPEALRVFSKRAGIELKQTFDKSAYSQKEKIYNLNNQSAKFYHYVLTKHQIGKRALNYLTKDRRLSLALIDTFSLGFSPSGSALSSYLINKKNYKKRDLLEAGISFERDGRIYDFFKNRIMFPLSDHHGNIVGFSGRILDDLKIQDGPKYINTKDTVAYHKGSLFFGLNIAKDEIKKQDRAILVEGEFDVISSFKEGIKNTIAIKGTALTENQVNLLARFAHKISLCLDKDIAGFEAMKRSLLLLEKKNLTTTVIVPPNGKDPDEAIKKDPAGFKKAIKNDIGIYDFLIEKILSSQDKKGALGKKQITDELLPFFAQIENEVIKEHYLKKLSSEIETSLESLQKEVDKLKSGAKKDEIIISKKEKRPRRELLEEYLLSLIIQSPDQKLSLNKTKEIIGNFKFEILAFEKIYTHLNSYFKANKTFNLKKFSSIIPVELAKSFDACYLFPLPQITEIEHFSKEIEKVSLELKTLYLKDRINALSKEIKIKDKDKDKVEKLKKEFSQLVSFLASPPIASQSGDRRRAKL